MIWLLLVIYQLKHFVCDYPLQGRYMLGKFKGGMDWVLPLTAHAAVHGAATLLIALLVKPQIAFNLALMDMVIHFTMDRIKASPNMLGRFKALSATEMKQKLNDYNTYVKDGIDHWPRPKKLKQSFKDNTYFWWALGLDQGVHHLTHYIIIYFLVK